MSKLGKEDDMRKLNIQSHHQLNTNLKLYNTVPDKLELT
jgi:hypothetical protein